MKIVTLALLAACFGQGNYLPEQPSAGTPGSKRIWNLVDVWGPFRFSAYARVSDAIDISESSTIRLAFADDGTACPIPNTSPWWTVAKSGDNLPCPAGWRRPR